MIATPPEIGIGRVTWPGLSSSTWVRKAGRQLRRRHRLEHAALRGGARCGCTRAPARRSCAPPASSAVERVGERRRSRPRRARRRAARSRRASSSRCGVCGARSRARRRGRPRSAWRGRGSGCRPPRARAGPDSTKSSIVCGRCRGRRARAARRRRSGRGRWRTPRCPASIAPSGSSISSSSAACSLTRSSVSCCDRELAQVAVGAERVEQPHALLDVVVGDHAVVDRDRRGVGVRRRAAGPASASSADRQHLEQRSASPLLRRRSGPRACRPAPASPARPSSPMPASRTLKPIEVEGGTLSDEV